ncbi:MAG TPA: inorganic diphosphatase [Candidatus Angelobacter sp.]
MKVYIENEAGSFIKHIYNEKTFELKTSMRVSRAYPFPYGFVPHTSAEDGDNVDCFVLTKTPLRTGAIVDCHVLGLMEQIEDGEVDHKILAAVPGETVCLDHRMQQALTDFALHVFDHLAGKSMRIGRFLDRRAAFVHPRQHGRGSAQVRRGSAR